MPFLIMLDEDENGYKAGRFLRASDLGQTTDKANGSQLFMMQSAIV